MLNPRQSNKTPEIIKTTKSTKQSLETFALPVNFAPIKLPIIPAIAMGTKTK